jgi:hypothetical protein
LIVVVVASFGRHHGQTVVVSCMKSFFLAPQFISKPIMMDSKMLTSINFMPTMRGSPSKINSHLQKTQLWNHTQLDSMCFISLNFAFLNRNRIC